MCISATKDNTVTVWNYHSGVLLRTFLLQSTPLCLTLDPCDRGVYVGFEDGSIQFAELVQPDAMINPLYDSRVQATPVQITSLPFSGSSEAAAGRINCLGLNYDGTKLLSGHESGKITEWDTARRYFQREIADLNAPVTNIFMRSPFSGKKLTQAVTVVKPKLAEGNYTYTAQFTGSVGEERLSQTLEAPGFPTDLLEDAIFRFSNPAAATSSSEDEKLRKDNEDLRKVVSEQQALLKTLLSKKSKTKS
jgi:pre-rRNA-processing protein IPI3